MNQQTNDRLQAILDTDYRFQFGEYISKGFNIFGRNAGMFIGFLFVSFFGTMVVAIIPLLGILLILLFSSALWAGINIVADKTARGEDVQFSNFFDGFKSWVPLLLSVLLQMVIFFAIFIPIILYVAISVGISSLSEGSLPSFSTGQATILVFVVIGTYGLLFYFAYSFIYTPMFILFEKMDAWEAMQMSRKFVGKHFFTHFFFYIVWGFIIAISAIPLGLGLLVTIPALSCSTYAAWADITDYQVEKTEDDDLMRHLIG